MKNILENDNSDDKFSISSKIKEIESFTLYVYHLIKICKYVKSII